MSLERGNCFNERSYYNTGTAKRFTIKQRTPRVHIDGVVWHLDVGSSHPGAVAGPKGWAVRPLKRYARWVQNVVRQFGPYPARAEDI